ncbi:predicted protein [Naegleria gruberi]|uniref:Predicted protein n=1 Tax=Naegleria gruberi TaxID=5762 RepID=D2V9A9_NAEGR|nr:uncharacterized protein NAEGRDRAFT_65376 [Naegleria gruberi]EFC46560.1 predicted protein [Naegleria gruberi]|eukprot:XP_002679304.1 predicted protein [Naegleria gruberi strain NEG-M]
MSNNKQSTTLHQKDSNLLFGMIKLIFGLIGNGTFKSAKLLFFVLKTVITSIAPSLNMEISSTPSIENNRMGVNTKVFLNLDWSVPLLSIQSFGLTNNNKQNQVQADMKRIAFEKKF